MRDYTNFYIDGAWVKPAAPKPLDVINPATEKPCGTINLGGQADVDAAVAAARRAFATFSQTTREDRLALLGRIVDAYKARYNDMAAAITEEMGAPASLSQAAQAAIGIGHFQAAQAILQSYIFEEMRGTTLIAREPIGVCGFITPWNWPINQIACKVAPALATGCTMVLKPSEIAPFSAYILAEILHEAGVPPGVFNLVNGDGPGVGAAISSPPRNRPRQLHRVSTRAGIEVARAAAPTVKRVHQELGGKSPNIILARRRPAIAAVTRGVKHVMQNTGQSCNAPTRMLAPHTLMPQTSSTSPAGRRRSKPPSATHNGNAELGPVVSETAMDQNPGSDQQRGIDEGAHPRRRRHRPPRRPGNRLLRKTHSIRQCH